MSAAHFSIERLARLEAQPVDAALAWLRSRLPASPGSPAFGSVLPRRSLFSCMVERSLPIPLDLLGVRALLLIDDEPALLRSISRVLRQAAPDLRIFSAEGARNGLEQATRLRPDAILVDAYMPDMPGVEVCARMHAVRANHPLAILAMTADPTQELAAAFARAGAIAFLEKPVDVPALFEVLSAHLVPNSAGDW